MVKFILFFYFYFFINVLYCQIGFKDTLFTNCDKYNRIHRSYIEYPVFNKNCSGTEDILKMIEFIQVNLKYPESAKKDRIEGTVYVQFWVDTNGFTSEHRIVKSVRQDVDYEALRVAKLIKYDIPAKNDIGGDKYVGICTQFPFSFFLEDNMLSRRKKTNQKY